MLLFLPVQVLQSTLTSVFQVLQLKLKNSPPPQHEMSLYEQHNQQHYTEKSKYTTDGAGWGCREQESLNLPKLLFFCSPKTDPHYSI